MIDVMKLVLVAKIPGSPSVKYVLLVLAYYANRAGWNIYPSISTVAIVTGYGEATVRRAFRELETLGLLVLVAPARQHFPNKYRIDLDAVRRLPQLKGRRGTTAITASAPNISEGNHSERAEDHQGDHSDRQGNHGEPQGDHHEPLSGSEPSRTGRDAAPPPNWRTPRRELGSRHRDTSHPVMPFTDRGRRGAQAAELWLELNRRSSEGFDR